MRISDWSSDVCSSDLLLVSVVIPFHTQRETNGYLRRALESIERQTIDGVQVIAVRDEERQGAAATRHAGLMLVDTPWVARSEEHTSELQSLMRISYAVFCLKKKNTSHV